MKVRRPQSPWFALPARGDPAQSEAIFEGPRSQPALHRVQTHPVATVRRCIRDALHRRKRGRCHRGEQAARDEQRPQHRHKAGEILHPGTRHLYYVSGAMSSVALPSSPALTGDFRGCGNRAPLARFVRYAPIAAQP
jgi:hypothetical protein